MSLEREGGRRGEGGREGGRGGREGGRQGGREEGSSNWPIYNRFFNLGFTGLVEF